MEGSFIVIVPTPTDEGTVDFAGIEGLNEGSIDGSMLPPPPSVVGIDIFTDVEGLNVGNTEGSFIPLLPLVDDFTNTEGNIDG